MSLCSKCKDKTCLKTKNPCPRVEKELIQMSVGKFPNTINLDSNYLDEVIVYDEDTRLGRFKEKKKRNRRYAE